MHSKYYHCMEAVYRVGEHTKEVEKEIQKAYYQGARQMLKEAQWCSLDLSAAEVEVLLQRMEQALATVEKE